MDITEFLLARIAEDEAVAEAGGAEGRSWKAAPNGYDTGAVEAVDGPPNDVGIVVYDEGRPDADQATHIARFDPARVLAECEAKRRIVTSAVQAVLLQRTLGGPEADGYVLASRDVLGALTLPYADHPDYQPEWSPLARA